MIINIVDEDVKREVKRVMKDELTNHLRNEIDKAIPEIVSARLKGDFESVVHKRVSTTIADHMEIATTIFLQKELNKQESYIREHFDKAIEKLLSSINVDNYFTKILGASVDQIVDARIKQQLKKSFYVEIKENEK